VRLTGPRISHLSHRLRNALQKGGLADFPDDPAAHREAKAVLDSYAEAEEAVDAFARTGSRGFPARCRRAGASGRSSNRKYFEEEIARRKL